MQPLTENAVNVPAFLSKLWKMVNDPSTNHLICWSPAGNSFIIQNQAQFWYELLPLYYKHNNMSSFVRQLNMYGFHKMTTVENGTMDIDKDEIQFYHPYFQKDQPEMLREIKRKVTGTKTVADGFSPSSIKTDVTKVLADVKQLRSHQQTVDSQLSAIKQENAVLWRELAMLRQKHMKQQQIVNKLIQFLVTIVQPSNRMSGLGVKRRYPLMIHGTPHKKSKTKNSRATSVGPTIHELDTEVLSDDLFEVSDDTHQQVQSPRTPNETSQKTPPDNLFDDVNIDSVGSVSPDIFLDSPELEYQQQQQREDKPEFISIDEFLDDPAPQTNEDAAVIDSLQKAVAEEIEESNRASDKVFLNPSAQDALLCNLISGTYNTNSLKVSEKDKTPGKSLKEKNNLVNQPTDNNMAIATRDSLTGTDYKRLTIEELDEHLQNTQSELDQLKDVLNGCGTFDANALLGVPYPRKLFSDSPSYSLSCGIKENPEGQELAEACNELTTYGSDIIDFNELFDEADLQDQINQDEWSSNTSKDFVSNNVQSIKKESSH